MKLSPRLQNIVDLVDYGSKVLDVGTDHGYVPLSLIKNGALFCIASDINTGPLEAARETLDIHGIQHKVSLRQGDGIKVINSSDEVDTIIIAGMGGETIIAILEQSIEILDQKTIILQPMTEVVMVREYLSANGFEIVDETIAREENRFYEIIKVKKNNKSYKLTCKELRCGPKLINKRDDNLVCFIINQIKKNSTIISNLKKSVNTKDKIDTLEKDTLLLEEVLQEIESWSNNSTD